MEPAEKNVSQVCTRCGSENLKINVPVRKMGVSYLSGVVVKNKPLQSKLCLDCGAVEFSVEDAAELADKELVHGPSANFLPFIIFALFILSLQLD